MICLAYLSTAKTPPTSAELEAIIAISERNNRSRRVTGMLCHYDGSFLQFLEGAEADVEATFGRISADPRHGGLIVLYQRPVTQRLFNEWSMALARVDVIDPAQRAFCKGLAALELDASEDHRRLVAPFVTSFRSWVR